MFIIRCCVVFTVLVKESLKAVFGIFFVPFFSAVKGFAYGHVFTARLRFHF